MRDIRVPVHPAAGDMTRLETYMRRLPGHKHLGEKWKDDPRKVLLIELKDWVAPTPMREIFYGYPPREVQHNALELRYVAVVPETVAQVIAWLGESDWVHLEVAPSEEEDLEELAVGLDQVWSQMPDPRTSLAVVQDVHEDIVTASRAYGIPVAALREVTMELWKDSGEAEHHQSLGRAVAVLGR